MHVTIPESYTYEGHHEGCKQGIQRSQMFSVEETPCFLAELLLLGLTAMTISLNYAFYPHWPSVTLRSLPFMDSLRLPFRPAQPESLCQLARSAGQYLEDPTASGQPSDVKALWMSPHILWVQRITQSGLNHTQNLKAVLRKIKYPADTGREAGQAVNSSTQKGVSPI